MLLSELRANMRHYQERETYNMKIHVIEPEKNRQKKLRTCAYCRVSTVEEEQENSLENQIEHYEELIRSNPTYEYVGIYHDFGISGFKESRPGFQNMMTDARAGKIDLIITKSISRFARNTDTLLKAVRELKELGIGVFFELQHINTLESTGELMLTVKGAFAQAESENYRKLAQMVYMRKYAAGIPVQYLDKSFGYAVSENGEYIPNPEEAPWIKKIFELCADGYNLAQISRFLNEQGVKTKKGRTFSESLVLQILNNEIYVGDYIMHKHFVNDERRLVKNYGEVDAWYVKNDHVPLIKRKLWDAAHERLEERRDYLATGSYVGDLDKTTYPYMKNLFCAECGSPLYRRVYSNGKRVNWGCSGQKRYTKEFCRGINVPDCVIREWGDISGNIYIRKEVDNLGKVSFKYVQESTWKKTHKKKLPAMRKPDIDDQDYPYKKYLHCAECGSVLTRYVQGTNRKIVWICSGYKHKGKAFCSGVRIPDEIVQRAADRITQDIYIRKGSTNGETGYSYTRICRQQDQKKE